MGTLAAETGRGENQVEARSSARVQGAMPGVSVVIPTYQRREYVCRAVVSVLAQRYADWELIVIDDGSTDGTEDAVRALAPNVRYVWQENAGPSSARNVGLRLARAEIVAFLDSDDRWLPDHLETVVAMLDRSPEAVLACTTPRFRIQGRAHVSEAQLVDALPLLFVENWIGYPSGTAVRREHLAAVGGFDEAMIVLEDGELWLRLAARGPFSFLQRRTIIRQITAGSLRQRGSRTGEYFGAIERMAQSAAAQAKRLARSDGYALAARAEGTICYSRAVRALDEADVETARSALATACRRLPELSREPWFIDRRLKYLAVDRRRRLEHCEAAASIWPDQRCDTALFLRAQAALIALRLGRLRRALALLPVRDVPGLLLRQRWLVGFLLRRRAQSYLYRGRDVARLNPP